MDCYSFCLLHLDCKFKAQKSAGLSPPNGYLQPVRDRSFDSANAPLRMTNPKVCHSERGAIGAPGQTKFGWGKEMPAHACALPLCGKVSP